MTSSLWNTDRTDCHGFYQIFLTDSIAQSDGIGIFNPSNLLSPCSIKDVENAKP